MVVIGCTGPVGAVTVRTQSTTPLPRAGHCDDAVCDAAIVIVVLAVAVTGATVAGENVHVVPADSAGQPKVAVPLKRHDPTLTVVVAKDRIFFTATAPCAAQTTGQEDAMPVVTTIAGKTPFVSHPCIA